MNKKAPSIRTGLLAPPTGFEPVTPRLTVECSAVELWGKATNEYYIRALLKMSNRVIAFRFGLLVKVPGAKFYTQPVDSMTSWTSRGPSSTTKYNERTERT